MKKEKQFESYLKTLYTSNSYVQQNIDNVNYVDEWFINNNITDIIHVSKNDIMDYVRYAHTVPLVLSTINSRLVSLRKYFNCLIKLGYILKNPALGLSIGRVQKKVVENNLSESVLNNLYQNFETFLDAMPVMKYRKKTDSFIKLRYKLLVSLMIYQGLDTGEINNLHVKDFNANKGTLYIAAKTKRNSRILKLEASQMLPLYQYLQMIPSTQEKLFTISVIDVMYKLLPYLRGLEPMLRNSEHIRQSRMMVWVSTLNLREAQYQIGHKWVSSTEGYQQQDTKELVDEINKLHLFK